MGFLVLIGFLLSIVVGVFLFIVWKNIFGKYLPDEDATLLKILCCVAHIIVCLIAGATICAAGKIGIISGIGLVLILVIVTYLFGLYYKVVASKKFKF